MGRAKREVRKNISKSKRKPIRNLSLKKEGFPDFLEGKKLERDFFIRGTLWVARNLLGKYIVRRIGDNFRAGKIVETEAYIGPQDKASHAFNWKRTPRNEAEYLEGGFLYVYLCYGVHWQLNIVTYKKGRPECVLIRALEPVKKEDREKRIASGPGKLTKWLKIDKSFDKEDLIKSKRIWVEDRGESIKKKDIVATERVGIDYAKEWADVPWRFYIKDNLFISRK